MRETGTTTLVRVVPPVVGGGCYGMLEVRPIEIIIEGNPLETGITMRRKICQTVSPKVCIVERVKRFKILFSWRTLAFQRR